MTFPEKLQALRRQQGWSQEELAARISISRQAVSKWESGTAVPDTANILALADLFGVSTDYLLIDGCDSSTDIPAACLYEAEMNRDLNRLTAWTVFEYLGLFWTVSGTLVHRSSLTPLFGAAGQIAGIIGFEICFHRYSVLPEARNVRRKFYQAAVWAFALAPCQFVLALLFWLKSGSWSGFPAIYYLFLAFLYLAVCLSVTRLLRPHRNTGDS